MVAKAKKVAGELEKEGIYTEVINARFLKPFDKELLISSVSKTGKLVTIEDGIKQGGLGSIASRILIEENMQDKWGKAYRLPR